MLVTVVILLLTLLPGTEPGTLPLSRCLICGARGLADVLLNVALFIPLGVGLALNRGSRWLSILHGACISGVVELLQHLVPGRDPSLGDLVFDTLGVAAGVGLIWATPLWLLPRRPIASGLCLAACVAPVAVVALSAYLLQPDLPAPPYSVLWTPNLAQGQLYRGSVTLAAIGDQVLLPHSQVLEQPIRRLLQGGERLQVQAITGPSVRGFAPLVLIRAPVNLEVIVLGARNDDLVFRFRRRAARLRLDQPELQLRGVMASVPVGTAVSLRVVSSETGFCISLNRQEECTLGPTVGAGWTLLMYPEHIPSWGYTTLGAMWMALLAVPLGFWSPNLTIRISLGGLLLSCLTLAPLILPLGATSGLELSGALAGLALGGAIHGLAFRVRPRSV